MRHLLLAAVLLGSACAGAAPIVRVDERACEGLTARETEAATRSAVVARRVVACARARGELGVLAEALRRSPAGAGRDHALGLALAAGTSEGWLQAERHLRAAFTAQPEVAAHGLRLGLFLLEAERWQDAVAPLEAATAADPADPGARVALAAA